MLAHYSQVPKRQVLGTVAQQEITGEIIGCLCEASSYLIVRLLDGALLLTQINLFHQAANDRFRFRQQPALTLAAVGLCGREIGNPAALLVKGKLAINRRRMYAGFPRYRLNHVGSSGRQEQRLNPVEP